MCHPLKRALFLSEVIRGLRSLTRGYQYAAPMALLESRSETMIARSQLITASVFFPLELRVMIRSTSPYPTPIIKAGSPAFRCGGNAA
jgi:hypothetical protein